MAKVNDTYDVVEAFKSVEDELMASMVRNLDHHRAEEAKEGFKWSQWQVEQLAALEEYKKRNLSKCRGIFKNINNAIDTIISLQRAAGNANQEMSILKAIKEGIKLEGKKRRLMSGGRRGRGLTGEFFKMNDGKVNALIKATKSDFQRGEIAILRMANDKYRQVIFNAQIYAASGATYEKAVDMATRDYLAAGLNCIEYKNGSRHSMSDYADMALRTAQKRAYLTGEGEIRQKYGISTVRINKRNAGGPCPKCLPFVGKVLIDDVWSGGSSRDGHYPLMSEAIAKGLYHPRCRDVHSTYFEGISTPPDDKFTEQELKEIEEKQKAENEQQYAHRQVERFDRLSKYSLDEDNKRIYAARKEAWEEKYIALSEICVENKGNSGIIKIKGDILMMNLQLFAERDIKKQESTSLKRAIRKYEQRIKEHEEYISNPKKHCLDWEKKSIYEQNGLKRHWEKEINNFKQAIKDRIDELKERGDYNG